MEVRIGTANKPANSTKAFTPSKRFECLLKDSSSIQNPVLQVSRALYNAIYNYAYIPDWGRYYFISSAVQSGPYWELSLQEDVLASWKTHILGTTQFVSRSDSAGNVMLSDNLAGHSHDFDSYSQFVDIGLNTTGTYLIYVISSDIAGTSHAVPSMAVYALTPTGLRDLCAYMFSADFYDSVMAGVDDTTKAVTSSFFNPFQYVVKCQWFPFQMSDFSTVSQPIRFGWWEAPYTAGYVLNHSVNKSFVLEMPEATTFADLDPAWSQYSLYVPSFGNLTIPSEYAGKTLAGYIYTDIETGESTLFMYDDSHLFLTAAGSLGCDVQLTNLKAEAFTGLLKFAAKAPAQLAGGAYGFVRGFTKPSGGLLETLNSASHEFNRNAMAATQPEPSTIGSGSNRTLIEQRPHAILSVKTYSIMEDLKSKCGLPCNLILELSELTGYCEVVDPVLDIGCLQDEKVTIMGLMAGGFYIE